MCRTGHLEAKVSFFLYHGSSLKLPLMLPALFTSIWSPVHVDLPSLSPSSLPALCLYLNLLVHQSLLSNLSTPVFPLLLLPPDMLSSPPRQSANTVQFPTFPPWQTAPEAVAVQPQLQPILCGSLFGDLHICFVSSSSSVPPPNTTLANLSAFWEKHREKIAGLCLRQHCYCRTSKTKYDVIGIMNWMGCSA